MGAVTFSTGWGNDSWGQRPRQDANVLRGWRETNAWVYRAIAMRRAQVADADWDVIVPNPRNPYNEGVRDLIKELLVAPNKQGKNNSFGGLMAPIVDDLLTIGLGAMQKLSTRGGQLYALRGLDGARLVVKQSWETEKDGPRYYYMNADGQNGVPFENDELIHLVDSQTSYDENGMPPLQVLYRTLQAEWDTFKSIHILQKNRSPAGLLVLPNTAPETVERVKGLFLNELAGKSGIGFMDVPEQTKFLALGSVNLAEQGAFAFYDMLIRAIASAFATTPLHLGWTQDVNRACMDIATESLTDHGWKFLPDILDSDRIATVNPATGAMEYHHPTSKHVYPYNGEMVRFQSRGVDIMVTPDHKMWFQQNPDTPWVKVEAQDLEGKKKFSFLGSVGWDGIHQETFTLPTVPSGSHRKPERIIPMDRWVEFLGYMASEGCIYEPNPEDSRQRGRYKLSLAQKKPENVPIIQACLDALPFTFKPSVGADGTTRWQVSDKPLWTWLKAQMVGNQDVRRLPGFVRELGKDQLSILFDALMLGDGSRDPRPSRTHFRYFSCSPGLAGDVQEVAMKLGYRTVIRPGQRALIVHCSRRKVYGIEQRHITREHYEGTVYCFNVPNHLFVTRRNGCVTIQGNTAIVQAELSDDGIIALLKMIQGIVNREIIATFPEATNLKFVFTQLAIQDKVAVQATKERAGPLIWVALNELRQDDGRQPLEYDDPKVQAWADEPLVPMGGGRMAPLSVAAGVPIQTGGAVMPLPPPAHMLSNQHQPPAGGKEEPGPAMPKLPTPQDSPQTTPTSTQVAQASLDHQIAVMKEEHRD